MNERFGTLRDMITSSFMAEITGIDGGPGPEFERIGLENGGFWYARQLMSLLGYDFQSA